MSLDCVMSRKISVFGLAACLLFAIQGCTVALNPDKSIDFGSAFWGGLDDEMVKATHRGDIKEVERLLHEEEADVNARDKGNGMTVLMWAVYQGHGDVARLLIEKGAHVNAKLDGGKTVLMFAAHRGRPSIGKLLIERGADVNAKNRYGGTALITAAGNGHLDVVELLIKEGAHVNAKAGNGATALKLAQQAGHAEIAKLLREKGASP